MMRKYAVKCTMNEVNLKGIRKLNQFGILSSERKAPFDCKLRMQTVIEKLNFRRFPGLRNRAHEFSFFQKFWMH